MNRHRMLTQGTAHLPNAAQRGHLTSEPCSISSIQPISGPRAGALEILAGPHAGDLLRALRRNDGATLRQFIPWVFKGEPQVYMRGRYLRVEAGRSDALADQTIHLEDLSPKPDAGGRQAIPVFVEQSIQLQAYYQTYQAEHRPVEEVLRSLRGHWTPTGNI